MNYFKVKLEFDKKKVDRIIQETITSDLGKGYVCVIESNNLTVANRNAAFMDVVNNSLVNICDGSVLAVLFSRLHKQDLQPYLGADLFMKYIEMRKYKQYFLGSTQQILDGLKSNLINIDPAISRMQFVSLPFRDVSGFDYSTIAQHINAENPDIIWVSLGAPKQELFMNNLLPYLDRGVMVGIGAVFNFNAGTGNVKRAPSWMRKLKLEWLYRAFEEPKKNIPRYWNFIRLLPKLIKEEKRFVQKIKHK